MAIGVALPIVYDTTDGFALNYSVKAAIKQNFKMLILTNPGERVMEPNFGVGILQFLFENFDSTVRGKIISKVNSQVEKYMPSIVIQNIDFFDNIDGNQLGLSITYVIPNLGIKDLLEFTI